MNLTVSMFVIRLPSAVLGVLSPSEELPVLYLSQHRLVRGLLTFQLPGLEDPSDG